MKKYNHNTIITPKKTRIGKKSEGLREHNVGSVCLAQEPGRTE